MIDLDRDKLNADLSEVIRPVRQATWETDSPWHLFHGTMENMGKDYGGLEYDPDFQRGHVWSTEQQTHYVENFMRGLISTSGRLIQFNCVNWENEDVVADLPKGFQCIDGLQRLTAIKKLLEGEVKPFGLSLERLRGSQFDPTRSRFFLRVAVYSFKSRAEVLQHYLDLNAGGTPHTPQEIERVRGLLKGVEVIA